LGFDSPPVTADSSSSRNAPESAAAFSILVMAFAPLWGGLAVSIRRTRRAACIRLTTLDTAREPHRITPVAQVSGELFGKDNLVRESRLVAEARGQHESGRTLRVVPLWAAVELRSVRRLRWQLTSRWPLCQLRVPACRPD
jgi:hypothetical protein